MKKINFIGIIIAAGMLASTAGADILLFKGSAFYNNASNWINTAGGAGRVPIYGDTANIAGSSVATISAAGTMNVGATVNISNNAAILRNSNAGMQVSGALNFQGNSKLTCSQLLVCSNAVFNWNSTGVWNGAGANPEANFHVKTANGNSGSGPTITMSAGIWNLTGNSGVNSFQLEIGTFTMTGGQIFSEGIFKMGTGSSSARVNLGGTGEIYCMTANTSIQILSSSILNFEGTNSALYVNKNYNIKDLLTRGMASGNVYVDGTKMTSIDQLDFSTVNVDRIDYTKVSVIPEPVTSKVIVGFVDSTKVSAIPELATSGMSVSLVAQPGSRSGWFPFPMPGLAAPSGTPVDMGELNSEPAGKLGFIRAVDGHFVDGSGRRLRLFGTNIAGQSLFLPDEDAASLALRLRQFGFNVLRLHMFDMLSPGNIWLDADKGTLDPEALRKLDFLIAECAKNGIYVNVNLHAARAYPGMPESIRSIPEFSRGQTFDWWYPPYIQMLKEYATQLFNHVNPYLGRRYAEEPAIACIEINNENTLIDEFRDTYRTLPEPFRSTFLSLWNQWLKNKYGSTGALADVWNRDVVPMGTELLTPEGWQLQTAQGAEGRLTYSSGVWTLEGLQCAKSDWSWQFLYRGLSFVPGQYTLTFEARSPQSLELRPDAKLDAAPWTELGFGQRVKLTPEWKRVTVTEKVIASPHPGPHRVSMKVENRSGLIEFRNLSLRLSGAVGLPEGQSLETGVDIPPDNATAASKTDYTAFLIDTEMGTTKDIRSHLRKTLGCRMPIIGTQVDWGGAAGLLREGTLSDYIDMHGYWNHPGPVPGVLVRNQTQVSDLNGGSLAHMARYRVAGLPFSVSEYNTSYPGDCTAETFPLLALFANLQDWDALYQYSYRSFTHEYAPKVIWQSQQIVGRSETLVHTPAAALMFRKELIAPWPDVLAIELPKAKVPELTAGLQRPRQMWNALPMKRQAAWFRRVELTLTDQGDALTWENDSIAGDGLRQSQDGRLRWYPDDPEGAWLAFDAPEVKLLIGHVGGRRFDIGGVTLTVDPRPWPGDLPAYACVSLVSLDGKPLADSQRMLLAASSRTENQDMRWNEKRTSLLEMSESEARELAATLTNPEEIVSFLDFTSTHADVLRRGWGYGPPLSEAVPLTLTMPGEPVTVQVLDASGKPSLFPSGHSNEVRIRAEMESLWFLLSR